MLPLAERISALPRVRLAHIPTPLHPLPRLSKLLGGPEIWIKRDDCTGLAGGGNKARKLEFLLADALAAGADTLITAGGVQSNHARQTAAAGAGAGLRVILMLANFLPDKGEAYWKNGNALLDRLFGAEVHSLTRGTNMERAMYDMAELVRRAGGRPYVIPVGGSSCHGVLGHVDAGLELAAQARGIGISINRIVVASGSGGTQAGLVLAESETGIPVTGFCVGASAKEQRDKVHAVLSATALLLGIDNDKVPNAVALSEGFVGEGYGRPTAEALAAICIVAREEGILLDPVYTGKAMAGLMESIRAGQFDEMDRIVFMHTGGSTGLFAYEEELNAAITVNGRRNRYLP